MEEDNYNELFKNAWCPLFGKLPTLNDPPSAQTSRCIRIIEEARALWGLIHYPEFPTSWPEPESISDEFFQYPTWKTKAARSIATARESILKYTQWYAMPSGIDLTATPDISYLEAIQQARGCTIPPLNKNITDAEILALLAIEEAWSVLGDILYYDEKESDILKQAQIAGMLLLRAKEIASSKNIEEMKPLAKIGEETLAYSKRNFFKKTGYTWYIKLKNEEITLNHFKGLEYIVFLIKNQSKKFTLDELYLAVNKHPLAEGEKVEKAFAEDLSTCKKKPDYTRDRQARLEAQRRIQEIDTEIKQKVEIANTCQGGTENDFDSKKILKHANIDLLLEERKRIEEDLKKSPSKFKNPDHKKKYDAVYQAIKTVLKDIAEKSPHIAKHLENSLNYKNTPFYYNPEEPTDWE